MNITLYVGIGLKGVIQIISVVAWFTMNADLVTLTFIS